MSTSPRLALIASFLMAISLGCGGGATGDAVDAAQFCTDDDQCGVGQLCLGGFCQVPIDAGMPADAPPGSADILVTPNSLDFGSPLLGIDTIQQIEIGNIGESDLHITAITIFENDSLPEYQASPSGPVDLTIVPGQSIMIAVTLRGEDAEADIGEVRIASDDPDEPQSVVNLVSELKGTPDVTATPTTVAYGTVSYGTSTDRDIDVTNDGTPNAPLVISAVSVTNTSGMGTLYTTALFRVDAGGTETATTLPVFLSPGDMFTPPGKLRIRVTFQADTGPGAAPDEDLVLSTNDPDEGTVSLPITGTVQGCAVPAPETCNGLDDDCDLTADEGDPGSGGACTTGLGGACNPGVQHCLTGSLQCVPNITPGSVPEMCNNIDDDCDGSVDDGLVQACTTACGMGVEFCVAGAWLGCNAPPVSPESCNSLDDDCDGSIDEGNPGGGVTCSAPGYSGVCSVGTTVCSSGSVQCPPNILPGTLIETCNNADDDCNGTTDDPGVLNGLGCSTGQPGVCSAGSTLCSGGVYSCQQTTAASSETCNGLDDDCNGSADEMSPTVCASQNPGASFVGSWGCSGGACQVASCQGGHTNPDTAVFNGCECTTDAWSNSCPAASVLTVGLGGTVDMTGKIETAAGSDWIRYDFVATGVGSAYHPAIQLIDSGGGQYRMDVQTDCSTIAVCGSGNGIGVTTWEQNYNLYTPGPACCADFTGRATSMYVRVYRTFGDAITCTPYTVRATNF